MQNFSYNKGDGSWWNSSEIMQEYWLILQGNLKAKSINLQVSIDKNKICLMMYINNVSLGSEDGIPKGSSVLDFMGSRVKKAWIET